MNTGLGAGRLSRGLLVTSTLATTALFLAACGDDEESSPAISPTLDAFSSDALAAADAAIPRTDSASIDTMPTYPDTAIPVDTTVPTPEAPSTGVVTKLSTAPCGDDQFIAGIAADPTDQAVFGICSSFAGTGTHAVFRYEPATHAMTEIAKLNFRPVALRVDEQSAQLFVGMHKIVNTDADGKILSDHWGFAAVNLQTNVVEELALPSATVGGQTFDPTYVSSVIFAGQSLFVATSNLSLKPWTDPATGETKYLSYNPGTVFRLNYHTGDVSTIATTKNNPSGLAIATIQGKDFVVVNNAGKSGATAQWQTTADGSIDVIDPATGTIGAQVANLPGGMGLASKLPVHGAKVALGAPNGLIYIIDLESMNPATEVAALSLRGVSGQPYVSALGFSPTGQRLVAGEFGSGTVQRWTVGGTEYTPVGDPIVVDPVQGDAQGISDLTWLHGGTMMIVAVGRDLMSVE